MAFNGVTMKLEVKKIDGVTAVILPDELAERLGLTEGGYVLASESADGRIELMRSDPATFERGMESARNAIKKYRPALKELAK